MKLLCNEGCQKEFEVNEIKSNGVEKLPANVDRYYIECPNCGKEYTSYFLDETMREMQAEIRHLKNKQNLKVKQKNRMFKLTNKLAAMNAYYMNVYQELVEKSGQ
ncbi:hypothetical protein P4641_08515 [Halalkalibacterium halodurans]|uniref:hypothetical protein n=1 Tax=Halalkalibacterium halodurans TaxID=86665 RepID=UPI002E1ADB3D|nr:hypothetical protein [Halalkalibacterium halodurans]